MNKRRVEYLLIGGTLAIAYGVPRVTKDIDIFIKCTKDNADQLLAALKDLGMGTADLTNSEEICANEITIFKDMVRLDVLTNVKGLKFDEASRNKVFISLNNVDIPSLNLEDLIKSKRAAARPPDIEDLKILELARKKAK